MYCLDFKRLCIPPPPIKTLDLLGRWLSVRKWSQGTWTQIVLMGLVLCENIVHSGPRLHRAKYFLGLWVLGRLWVPWIHLYAPRGLCSSRCHLTNCQQKLGIHGFPFLWLANVLTVQFLGGECSSQGRSHPIWHRPLYSLVLCLVA